MGFKKNGTVKKMNSSHNNISGFTLVEMIAVLVILGILGTAAVVKFLDLKKQAQYTALQSQAGNLRANNNINVAACQVNSPQCLDITVTGDEACELGLEEFMPAVDSDMYGVTNIPSNTPQEDWESRMESELASLGKEFGAIYWVDRFLLTPPTDAWLQAGWNTRQPCILYVINE